MQSCSTFSDCRQLSTSLNAEFQKKRQKFVVFFVSPPQGDKIKRSKRILMRKRALWVNYSTPDLALIGKRGSVQEPPNVKRCPKLWSLATGNRNNEHIQLACRCRHSVCFSTPNLTFIGKKGPNSRPQK